MTGPRVPGSDVADSRIELPCGERLDPRSVDLGMRSVGCACGERHAIVLDVHPPSRFVPESLVEVLREAIETDDAFEQFGTPHLMGLVLEEFPEGVVVHDASDDGTVGYALLWVTDVDDRRLHEILVELLVELMDHAMSHAEDDDALTAFESQLQEFDVGAFVSEYRAVRDVETNGNQWV